MAEARAEQTPGGTPPTSGPLDPHYTVVVKAIVDGRVVPFLGAGVNLCSRPQGITWQHGQHRYLPNGKELAAHLAKSYGYPSSKTQFECPSCKSAVSLTEEAQDLLRVSQYVVTMSGQGSLYYELHSLFDADYPPTSLHQFLATLPKILRQKSLPSPYQLIVTTNYDDLMERAFQDACEPFDVITYMVDDKQPGKFLHRLYDGKVSPIDMPNEYRALPIEMPSLILKRPVILKIHGAVDRVDPDQDSYVITEDHYIDYLTRTDISNLMPKALVTKLKYSHFLFLGYSLRDWNLRAILHHIWNEQKHAFKSWAIQVKPETLDQEFWKKREVDIHDIQLEDYIAALSTWVQAFSPVPRPA